MASGLEDQIARLEAVATRLEQVALGAGKKKSSGGSGPELSEGSEAWVELRKNEIEAFLKAVEAVPDQPSNLVEKLRAAYDNCTDYICAGDSCKKPTPEELSKKLAPTIEAIGYYDGQIYKHGDDFKWHFKAFASLMQCMTWVSMAPPNGLPKATAKGEIEACDFSLNKLLMKAKKCDENRAMAKACKAMGAKLIEVVKEHYVQGIAWVGQKSVLDCEGAKVEATPAAAEEKAPEPKKAKKAAPKKAAKPMADVGAELSKGLAVTSGLKKVQKSQKNKYKKDKVSGKVTGGVKKAKAKKKLPDPKKTKRGFTWFLEYYQEGLITLDAEFLPGLNHKTGIFIASSLNCQFLIPPELKVKSIVIDGCKRVQVQSAQIVSTVEMVNSQNCTLWLNGVTPSVTVDKCDSPKLVIMPPCYDQPNMVDILTSNVTAGNIELPPQGDDDGKVLPIPEQYFFKIDKATQTATTVSMQHAG